MFPVRCFTCNKIIGGRWEFYKKECEEGKKKGDILDFMGMTRYCCRRMFLCHVELVDQLLIFPNDNNRSNELKLEEKTE